jgi:hypothetical protein
MHRFILLAMVRSCYIPSAVIWIACGCKSLFVTQRNDSFAVELKGDQMAMFDAWQSMRGVERGVAETM